MTTKTLYNTNDSGDLVGSIPFFASDGRTNKLVAELRVYVDGPVTPASGNVPSRFELWTNTTSGVLTKAAVLDAAQALTVVGTQTFTGALTATGGVVRTGRSVYGCIPIGSVAYSSLGTNTSASANSMFLSEISIDRNVVLTGIGILNGAQAAGNSIYGLYDSAGANLLASTASTANAGLNSFQQIAFSATYSAVPGRYWIAAISNNGSHTYRTTATATFVDVFGDKQDQGGFALPASFTPPASVGVTKGVIGYAYA